MGDNEIALVLCSDKVANDCDENRNNRENEQYLHREKFGHLCCYVSHVDGHRTTSSAIVLKHMPGQHEGKNKCDETGEDCASP